MNREVKIKCCGMKLKCRVVPWRAIEPITDRFIMAKLNTIHMEDVDRYRQSFNYYMVNGLLNKLTFEPSTCIGDSVQDHPDRLYLEVLSDFYNPVTHGGITRDHFSTNYKGAGYGNSDQGQPSQATEIG